jgi:hypothetical protein
MLRAYVSSECMESLRVLRFSCVKPIKIEYLINKYIAVILSYYTKITIEVETVIRRTCMHDNLCRMEIFDKI